MHFCQTTRPITKFGTLIIIFMVQGNKLLAFSQYFLHKYQLNIAENCKKIRCTAKIRLNFCNAPCIGIRSMIFPRYLLSVNTTLRNSTFPSSDRSTK